MHFHRNWSRALFPLLCVCATLNAATITGHVRDAKNNAYLLGANVTVRELNRSTSTSAGGEFTLSNIPAGSYTLVASSLGFSDQTTPITVSEQGTPPVDIALNSDIVALTTFVVEGSQRLRPVRR